MLVTRGMMLPVIYICCLDAIDATMYASKVLEIKLRVQGSNASLMDKLTRVPSKCTGLDIRATPEFWTALTHPAVLDGADRLVDTRARRNLAVREARGIQKARTIATAVRLRGGEIRPPYDVPTAMDERSIEDWLNER